MKLFDCCCLYERVITYKRANLHGYYFKRSMAEKRKICNLEAYDKYIKKFKSDWEAAGLFLSDEGLLSEKADVLTFQLF